MGSLNGGGLDMPAFIDINGYPLEMEKVSEFRVVKVEYVYYPVYKQFARRKIEKDFLGRIKEDRSWFEYTFSHMEPYGAILGEENRPTIAGYKPNDFKEALIKDIKLDITGLAETGIKFIANTLRINKTEYRKYLIQRPSGRIENICLDDIPVKLITDEEQEMDIYRNDERHKYFGTQIVPTRKIIPALFVREDGKPHLFIGYGIDIDDVAPYYEQIKHAKEEQAEIEKQCRLEQENRKREQKLELPKISIPRIELPKVDLPEIDLSKVKLPDMQIQIPFGKPKKNKDH